MKAALLALLLAAPVAAADKAALESVKTEWQNFYGVILYSATAQVKNASPAPLRYVKVKFVLHDKDDKVVAEKIGYNLGAESLGEEGGAVAEEKLAGVQPIAPGASDAVRVSFEKPDIPRPFRSAELTILEAR